ncbi:hypothetical protein PHYSODRAFT_299660 [Phytophthora sojae]|uniref:HTH La-type RNA-binding domain-containing protein n=1 Tax=Phytophthora sojae (strain P6497) TaxID=1094619 RepID=G4Z4V8_PHYSP|nr:hypothetical protein PHYSODRAFT_299660 [Phytophthora sojae]EGZ22287.1 hypothetical protein PHYSODRAFT_299660 [Phytophthora sojae]|eukprot:XP_009525004.1 hypothetical protein PHYSODRAFT_299660 [Phytophthora sojae]
MASLEAHIKKQVELYFSDSNLRRDRFLRKETKKREGGCVPFTFKKLAALTVDGAVLQAAIVDSDVVEINETKNALRRRTRSPTQHRVRYEDSIHDSVGFGDAVGKILGQNMADDAQLIMTNRTTARMREIPSEKKESKTA